MAVNFEEKKRVEENQIVSPDIIYAREKDIYCDVPTDGSDIVNYYKGKSIFITGASGFLGKVLVEKLLRTCPDIKSIYILCRDKKGKDVHTRVDEIYNDVLFTRLSKTHPKFRHKIIPVKGDVSLAGLGINLEDRKVLASEVNVIFHVAATVRFDEKISLAVAINVKGTKEILQIGQECSNLESFVHVSTAFANCPSSLIKEQFYTAPYTTKEIIEIVDTTPEIQLDKMQLDIIGKWPNTYAFTKAIAEETVNELGKGLPLCIFRPAIVISTYQEPVRGWIDNVYGPTGVITGAGLGILRTLHCDGDTTAEIVPVDLVVNAMIVASYKNTIERYQEPPIYNYVSSVQKPITWQEYTNVNKIYGCYIPTIRCIWYYSLTLNKYRIAHLLYSLFLHFLPALIIDGFCLLTGKEAQLLKVYKKIHKFTTVITYFSTNRWTFTNDNVQSMWKSISAVDQNVFPFDMSAVDWEYHSQMNIMGIRTYLVKDDPSTLPVARKKWQRFLILHRTLQVIFVFIILRLLYGLLESLIL